MILFKLAYKSLLNRRASVLLTLLTIAISVMLLLSIERVRVDAKSSFSNTISGTDLIVGARTGDIQLLLSSVLSITMRNTRSSSVCTSARAPPFPAARHSFNSSG